MSDRIEDKLQQLGYELPPAPEPVGYYVPVLRTGNLVITSGQLPAVGKEIPFKGKVGQDLGEQEAADAARICAINALSQIKACVGDLEKIARVVRVEGYVQSGPNFSDQAQVINGASQLLVDALGEKGKHTRIAVGVAELPLNASVELAVWVEVEGSESFVVSSE